MNATTTSKEFRFTGWHMVAIMGAFFGVIIAVNFTMATMASRSWTGLVVKNSYVASQQFNADLANAKLQKARGWTSQLTYVGGEMTFTLRDKDNAIIQAKDLTLSVGRPAFEQEDRTINLTPSIDGTFRTALDLGSGIWAFQVALKDGDRAYRRDARITVGVDGNGMVE